MDAQREGSAGRAPRRKVERAWLVIGVVLLGAVALGLLGAIQVPERHDDMWFEVFSGAVRLMVLAITGGVVAAVLRDRDATREESRRRQAAAAAFLERVQDTFSHVKSARRMLRTHGFGSAQGDALTDGQVAGFRTEMALLNDAELEFEMYARRIAIVAGPYADRRDELVSALAGINEYLKGILREWQQDPAAIAPGHDPRITGSWERFARFVGYDEEAVTDFRTGIADRMVAIEVLIGTAGSQLGAS